MINASHKPGASITPGFIWATLRRWWRWVTPIGIVLATGVGAFLYFSFTPTYKASSYLQIYNNRYVVYRSRSGTTSAKNHIAVLKSPMVIAPVVAQKEIASLPVFKDIEDPVSWLGSRIRIRATGDEYYSIEFVAEVPSHAQKIVEAVAGSFANLRDSVDREESEELIRFLSDRREIHKREVTRMQEVVRGLSQAAGASRAKASETPMDQAESELRTKLIDAIVEREVLQAQLAVGEALRSRVDESKGAELTDEKLDQQVNAIEGVAAMRKLIADKKKLLEETQAVVKGGANSPKVAQLSAEVTQAETDFEALRVKLKDTMKSENAARSQKAIAEMRGGMERADYMVQFLEKRLEAETKVAQQQRGEMTDLEFAQNDLAKARDVFERIDQRILQLQTERGLDNVKLLPDVAGAPTMVERFPYMAIVKFATPAFLLPFVLAVLWEIVARRVNSRQELEQITSLSVIGEIPSLTFRRSGRGYQRALGPYQESIDSLRTQLVLSDSLSSKQVLAVTSAVSGEGKTSVSAQLALSLCRSTNAKVLLIDGDLRCPDIHRVFDLGLAPGLADVLGGTCELDDALACDENSGLHILTAGRLGSTPLRLFSGPKFQQLIDQLRQRYRYLIIDTPPVLSASEALEMAKIADCCLMSTMRDKTRTDRLRIAHERLVSAGARPTGIVLNGVSRMQYAYRYGRYDYYADGQGDSVA